MATTNERITEHTEELLKLTNELTKKWAHVFNIL
jgi:hypothetical protein